METPKPKRARRKNKRSREIMERAIAAGETPLEYMLRVMRGANTSQARKDEMAKAAAPYCHPKLISQMVTGAGGGAIDIRLQSAKANLDEKLSDLDRRLLGSDGADANLGAADDGASSTSTAGAEAQTDAPLESGNAGAQPESAEGISSRP